MSWELSFEGFVTRVFPRSLVTGARKIGDETVFSRGPELWHVQIGDVSFQVGEERPQAQVGDKVSITLKKVP